MINSMNPTTYWPQPRCKSSVRLPSLTRTVARRSPKRSEMVERLDDVVVHAAEGNVSLFCITRTCKVPKTEFPWCSCAAQSWRAD